MTRRRPLVGAALLASLMLAGCGGTDGVPAASSPTPQTSAATATPATPDPGNFTPPPSGLVDEDTGETITPKPVPEWDATSRASVVKAAESALRAFARPDLDYDTWWADLAPLLTEQAAEDYAYVDPANVPVRKVTGGGVLVDDTSAYVASVEVPTDVGTYTLVLNRTDAETAWRVSRITPPEGVQ